MIVSVHPIETDDDLFPNRMHDLSHCISPQFPSVMCATLRALLPALRPQLFLDQLPRHLKDTALVFTLTLFEQEQRPLIDLHFGFLAHCADMAKVLHQGGEGRRCGKCDSSSGENCRVVGHDSPSRPWMPPRRSIRLTAVRGMAANISPIQSSWTF